MKGFFTSAALAALMITSGSALPSKGLWVRGGCNHDDCYRAATRTSIISSACSSYMTTTVTPCPTTVTVTSTASAIDTITVSNTNYPMRRVASASPSNACPVTTAPTSLPAFATTACTPMQFGGSAARFSSACSCLGYTSTITTLPAQTSTVTSTASVTATASVAAPPPPLFILQSSSDQSLYVTLDKTGALVLTQNQSAANPFYVDHTGQWRNAMDPTKYMVDYYIPNTGTADNQVFNAAPAAGSNYNITCNSVGHNAGDFWGDCQASGPPDGNPVVYGFGTCPNEGYYVYMIPNNSNVRCYDGGYAFIGFFLVNYTPSSQGSAT